MTTSPVMGITEEILGEIERADWKLAPVEPTQEMVDAGDAVQDWPAFGLDDIYRAMLAAAPAAPVAQEPSTFWVLFNATADKKYIKKIIPDGPLAFFDCESDALRAKARNPGTDYKRVDYYTAPPAAEQLAQSAPDELRARCDGGTCGMGGVCENCMMADAIELATEQPDTVVVPRELLERAVDRLTHGHELDKACRELRALLAGGAE